jgi:type I restriction enzyme R subunit
MKFSHRMESIKDLKKHLSQSKQGGIFFTTIQKFQLLEKEKAEKKKFSMLNDRSNIIILVDEAHRTQYNNMARNLARALPKAKRIGFTGTPIEINEERNTRTVFGPFISEYTIKQAEEDKVVVPIWYDPRKPKDLELNIEELSKEVEKYVKDHTPEAQENFKRKWSKIDVILSDDKFIQKTADDIVKHFNERYMKGKAMLVTATREIAVKYKEYLDNLPNAPKTGIAISKGNSKDPQKKKIEDDWESKGYFKDKEQMKDLRKNFKKIDEEPQLLIVCDMLLTGYSASCLTTMYFLKPMKTHNLLQAIARVNRVYKNKPAGILVDYISIGDKIAEAVKIYSGKLENVMLNINQAVDLFQSKFRFIFNKYGIPKSDEFNNKSALELRRIRNIVLKNITASDDNKKLFLKETLELKKLFAIVSPREESLEVEEEVMYILGIRNEIVKKLSNDKDVVEIDKDLMRDLVSKHLEVGDIEHLLDYSSKKISVFSEDFIESLRNFEGKNLQVEILKKILNDQIQIKLNKNIVKQQKFKDRLTKLMKDYKARYVTVEDLIKHLIDMGKELDENPHRHVQLGLSEDELTFYDIFKEEEKNALDDDKIKAIVKDLVTYLSKATQRINWTNEDDFKKKIRAKVKDLLATHGFKRSEAEPIIVTIMKQTTKLYASEF